VNFQIPHNFLIRIPPEIVQIGALEARIRPFRIFIFRKFVFFFFEEIAFDLFDS